MKLTLAERRKPNPRLVSFNPEEASSFQIESAPPSFNSSIRQDSEPEPDQRHTKYLNSNTFTMCLRCDRLRDELRMLHSKLQEAEENTNYYKAELNRTIDLQKNSRIYAVELKNSRLEQDIQQCHLDKTRYLAENSRLKKLAEKLEKDLNKKLVSYSSLNLGTNLEIEKVSNFCVFGCRAEKDKGISRRLQGIREFECFQNTFDLKFEQSSAKRDFSNKTEVFSQIAYLQSNFRRLSNEFSNMLVMLESVVQLVFFNVGDGNPEKLEEKTDARRVVSYLLTSLNGKLMNIKLIFQEIQQVQDPFKELNSSWVSKNSEEASDELLVNKYINSKAAGVYSEFDDNQKIEKFRSFHERRRGLENLKKQTKILNEFKAKIKNEVLNHREVFQESLKLIRNEVKKIGIFSNRTRTEMEKQISDNTERYQLAFNENKKLKIEQDRYLKTQNKLENTLGMIEEKNEEISQLTQKVQKLEEREKNLNSSIFSLSKERLSLEPLSSGTTAETEKNSKLKEKIGKYKNKNKSLKKKYNDLKDEYNTLYLETSEILKNLQENTQVKSNSDPQVSENFPITQSDNQLLEAKSKIIFLLKLKLLVFQEKLKKNYESQPGSKEWTSLHSDLLEEKLKNKSLSESLKIAKNKLKNFEKILEERSEKLLVYLENNSELSSIVEELTAEKQELKNQLELLQAKYLKKTEDNEIKYFRGSNQEDALKRYLKTQVKQLRSDLKGYRKKLYLSEDFNVLNEPFDKIKEQLETEKIIENYRVLNQENLKLKELLNIIDLA